MPLYWNGTEMDAVYWNGVEMTSVYWNGVEIYTSFDPNTAQPNIENYSGMGGSPATVYWKVRNQDSSTATIKTEVDDNEPDLKSFSLAGNTLSSTQSQTGGWADFSSVNIYATAQKSGGNLSPLEVQSVTIFPGM